MKDVHKLLLILIILEIAQGLLASMNEVPVLSIHGGKYIYYNMSVRDAYVYFELSSLKGDCDLYISEETTFPTFDNYQWSSTTCGADSIIIHDSVKGKLSLGVYGHPSYEENVCHLYVCAVKPPSNTSEMADKEWIESLIFKECFHEPDSWYTLIYALAKQFFKTVKLFLKFLISVADFVFTDIVLELV